MSLRYLLAIIVILGLGVASYFQLGLDKVKSAKPSDASDQEWSLTESEHA